MKFLALLLLSVVALTAKDIGEVRFPFVDEKEMSAFIARTEPQLGSDLQKRVWQNGLRWMREESERKRVSFPQWLRGMHATDMILLGYTAHCKALSDQIESLAKEARMKNGEEAARLNARAAELSKWRDALTDEMTTALHHSSKR